jgi:hypothetical protein
MRMISPSRTILVMVGGGEGERGAARLSDEKEEDIAVGESIVAATMEGVEAAGLVRDRKRGEGVVRESRLK